MADFERIVKKTFGFEGGFQNDPEDTANYCNGQLIGTNRGISAVGYKGYYGKCPTVAEIKALTEAQAYAIYKKNYWTPIQGDLLNSQSVAHIFFEAHIASGGEGLKRIKKYVNTYYGTQKMKVTTSWLTSSQAALVNAADSKRLFDIAKAGEIANRNYLATVNPAKYGKWLNGWLNRLNKVIYDGASAIKRNPLPVVIFALLAMTLMYVGLNYKTILT